MIWLLGGTSEGRKIQELLAAQGYNFLVTVATPYGELLAKESSSSNVIAKPLTKEEMAEFIKEYGIKILIDATHPYAAVVSQNALAITEKYHLSYIRFQREASDLDLVKSGIEVNSSIEEAAQYLGTTKGKILLTTGSKTLDIFVKYIEIERIIARVLPTVESIKKCNALGIKPSNIIAMQGPFSLELNLALIKQYAIEILVTKESGTAGGTKEKLLAVEKAGIKGVLIKRPNLQYPNCFSSFEELLVKVSELYGTVLSHNG